MPAGAAIVPGCAGRVRRGATRPEMRDQGRGEGHEQHSGVLHEGYQLRIRTLRLAQQHHGARGSGRGAINGGGTGDEPGATDQPADRGCSHQGRGHDAGEQQQMAAQRCDDGRRDGHRNHCPDDSLPAHVGPPRDAQSQAVDAKHDASEHRSQKQRGRQPHRSPQRADQNRQHQQHTPLQRLWPRSQCLARGGHTSVMASAVVIRASRGRMCLKLNACVSALMQLHRSSGITSS
jgi:hypothetical protein